MNTTKTWKRILAVVMAVLVMLGAVPLNPYMSVQTNAAAAKVYMKPNSNWLTDGARFAAYFFGNGETWVSMTDSDGDGIYEANVPSGYTSVIFCRMNPSATANNWNNKWNQTGDLTVPTGSDVLYTVSGWGDGSWGAMSFSVSFSLSNVSKSSGNTTAKYGTNYTASLTASTGYSLPSSITVKAGSTTLAAGTGYSYDSSTGAITIFGSAVTGKITITASGVQSVAEYNVTFNGTNVSSNGATKATNNANYTATLSVDTANYSLPSSITVTAGSTTLTSGTDYTYSSSTGVLTIYAAKITGEITITAEAGKISYNVTFNGSNVSSDGAGTVVKGEAYTATLTASTGYDLPTSITVTVAGQEITGFLYSNGSLSIPSTYINGDIVITAVGEAQPVQGVTVYLDPGEWAADNARFAIYYWDDSGNAWADMTYSESDGYYTVIVPEGYTNLIFCRMNPSGTDNIWENTWNQTDDLTLPTNGNNLYTITGWGPEGGNSTGTWSKNTSGSGDSSEQKDTFYVNTDIVDYLNDYRVNSGAVNVYSNDNQGIWMDKANNPVFSYLNYIIACQQGYSYPLYFGNMLNISNRFGVKYSAFTTYEEYANHREKNKENLTNWNTGANVALDNNGTYNAVVQGLVGNRLDEYGQLMDPKTENKQLFYFDKTSIESWKTSDGTKRLAAYYSNLQFPFNATYDADTRVTTYSYDSATDDAVFIDYDNYDENSAANPMYTSSDYTKDQYNNKGFFPLNKPGDTENAANYGFGVKFTIDFTVSDDGTIVATDGSETPVQFTFTGDDDVWVFIDGYLVLDMGGAHTMATGTIDFKELNATVKQRAQVSDTYFDPSYYNSSYGYGGDGPQRESLTIVNNVPTAFPEELAAQFQTEYTTGISQVHTLTMFYMERGTIESNMSIEFSMSPVPTGLTVSKDIENVNPGLNAAVQDDDEFSFTIEATDKDDNEVIFNGYDLTDHSSITTNMTATNNTITGVRGDRYAHNFTYGNLDAFSAGTSFVVTEGSYDTSKYSGTKWVLYRYDSDGYTKVAENTGVTANFATDEETANYALNFVNTLKAGTLTLSKSYLDTLIDSSNMEFVFEVYLDLNDEGYELYPGLTYDLYNGNTLVSEALVSNDGKIVLKAGQTAKINGIPVGTAYKIVEVDDSALWEVDGSDTVTGTMTESGAEVSFTNKTTSTTLEDKVIFVEANKDTTYTIKDGSKTITLNSVSSGSSELTVSVSNGKAIVNGSEVDAKYTFSYAGTYSDGSYVSGKVTVYTFAATDKVYVFDFGLPADLAATNTNGDGLFQGGNFYNSKVSGESAILASLSGNGNTQTTITFSGNPTVSDTGICSGAVTFQPVAFMTQVETYTYTVKITASDKTFVEGDPETGTIVTGSIKVMPANTVYYEDNFNVEDADNDSTQEIIYTANGPSSNPSSDFTQSIDQSSNYGYDAAYLGGYAQSNGSATTLSSGNIAYFTFTGTGFDLLSQTNGSSAGVIVYIFTGTHDKANLTHISNYNAAAAEKLVFVDTYYNNGDLYQVPVISVQMTDDEGKLMHGTYTAYVQVMSTGSGKNTVTIDGIRIYNPLSDTSLYPLLTEQNTTVDELRELYGTPEDEDTNGIVSLAGRGTNGVFNGLGKADAVIDAMENASIIEDMEGNEITSASDLENIFLHGPNNEMYLPMNFGVAFSYEVTDSNWTLQLGAKAVSADGKSKSISVYIRSHNKGSYTDLGTITLSSSTDMYYELNDLLTTDALKAAFGGEGTYDIIIISNSAYESNEFVSLTTVKHSGITLI